MPIVNFNDSVSQTIPLYSLNVQTIAALANTNIPDLSVYVGVINQASWGRAVIAPNPADAVAASVSVDIPGGSGTVH